MDNITSTLTIVVFSSEWSWMFALYYVRCVVISNWKLWTTEKRQHRFGITRNIACVLIHACVLTNLALHSNTLLFFQRSFARSLKNTSLIIWYCCNIWRYTKYLIFFTSGTAHDLSWMSSFSWPHGVSLFANFERCVVVFFSGLT